MKINAITSINNFNQKSSNINLKEDNINTKDADLMKFLAMTPASLSFQATRRVPLKGLELKNESAEKLVSDIVTKLNRYNQKEVRGNFLKPFVVETPEVKYLFTLNNSDPKNTRFEIRNFVNPEDAFRALQDNQCCLKFAVDAEGKIMTGDLSKKVNDKFTRIFELRKVSDNINRIKTNEGLMLQNSRSKDKFTTRIDLCKDKVSKEFDMYRDFTDFDPNLSEIFFKLVQGRSLYL